MASKIRILVGIAAIVVAAATVSRPLIELLLACLVVGVGLVGRELLSPHRELPPASAETLRAVHAVVERWGEDSLAPFITRPDKAFRFTAGGVAAYRVIGDTAVVSGDPVGPDAAVPEILADLREAARAGGMKLVVYGSSPRHIAAYRKLGLRALCTGEEAVVDPRRFSLEGRAVRKLRQSVARVQRRGWDVTALTGDAIDPALAAEIAAVEAAWRAEHGRVLGFAMAMGNFDPGLRPADLYLLGRTPEGELRAVMRFLSHCGKLSLDTMRRVGETPNGLNEALVCRALEVARERGVEEVSLNYAGLGHLVRRGCRDGRVARALNGLLMRILGHRFQMERLVRFCEKFSPEWRPRYLVYESRLALPRSILRVLQAEGYLPHPMLSFPPAARGALRARVDGLLSAFRPLQWRAGR
ncbi:MAG TPA: phosphatidylglycerol lysyltransferase domain-containing protein [Solirubrobacteraceae bacterium]|nr:phosphatidylglycerol lysyltransferase domain-containing protein [Solirubrobacteraceae bacterium]